MSRLVDSGIVQAKLDRRVANSKIKELNPPTPGKHCLVLDIDFTIFDLVSPAPEALPRCSTVLTSCPCRARLRRGQRSWPGHTCTSSWKPCILSTTSSSGRLPGVPVSGLRVPLATDPGHMRSMRWIEVKMRELGVTTQPDRFKVSLFLDHQSMVRGAA